MADSAANWHPRAQRDALSGLPAEVGFVGAAVARKAPDGSLVLIDGHLRRDALPGESIPVLLTDLTEEEPDKLLATYDPLGAMATRDDAALQALLDSLTAHGRGAGVDPAGLTAQRSTNLRTLPMSIDPCARSVVRSSDALPSRGHLDPHI